MANIARQSNLADQLAAFERRIGILEKATSLRSASIGAGGLTIRDGGGLTVKDGGDIAIIDGGTFTVSDAGGTIWDSDRDLGVPRAMTDTDNGLNYTGAFTNYMGNAMLGIPYGMTAVSLVLNCSAGETLTGGEGNLSVAAALEWFDSGGSMGVGVGAYNNSGANVIPVAWSFNAVQGEFPPGATSFRIGVSVADVLGGGASRVPNTGAWTASCFAIFTRAT